MRKQREWRERGETEELVNGKEEEEEQEKGEKWKRKAI